MKEEIHALELEINNLKEELELKNIQLDILQGRLDEKNKTVEALEAKLTSIRSFGELKEESGEIRYVPTGPITTTSTTTASEYYVADPATGTRYVTPTTTSSYAKFWKEIDWRGIGDKFLK